MIFVAAFSDRAGLGCLTNRTSRDLITVSQLLTHAYCRDSFHILDPWRRRPRWGSRDLFTRPHVVVFFEQECLFGVRYSRLNICITYITWCTFSNINFCYGFPSWLVKSNSIFLRYFHTLLHFAVTSSTPFNSWDLQHRVWARRLQQRNSVVWLFPIL